MTLSLPPFHEKTLFHATQDVPVGTRVSYKDVVLQEKERDLLIVCDGQREVVRVHHGMIHSTIIVFDNSEFIQRLLSENSIIMDSLTLEEDASLYPEVAPCAVFFKRLNVWWNDAAIASWTQQHLPQDMDDRSEWFHAVWSAKLLT